MVRSCTINIALLISLAAAHLVTSRSSKTAAKALISADSDERVVVLGPGAEIEVVHPHDTRHSNSDHDILKDDAWHTTGIDQKVQVSEETFAISKKPRGDHREYQHSLFANGLEVVNVHDNSTKVSAFAVAVTAGLYYDPPEHYGLAHLTEHSLFLGTKKFPARSGFDEFLAKMGGSSNAYTAEEVTVYYANLNEAGFAEGLDRFSDFFRAPLLKQDSIWQEVSAVVSEHSKNVQNPSWYSERVMLSLANPASPLQHFHTGDELTLKNLGPGNLTTELTTYFHNHYCPPRMKLVTFGAESLASQLQKAKSAFASIPKAGESGKCSSTKKVFGAPHAFPDKALQQWLIVEGTSSSAMLWMLFPLWDLAPWTKSHPLNYAEYMLSFGGKNSLNLVLRDQLGLAESVGLSSEDSSAGTMVWITAALTPKGADKPEAVMDVIFTFLEHAKKRCSKEAIKSLAKSTKLVWDWPNPMEAAKAASVLAEGMTRLAPQELLAADDLMEELNMTRVLEVLNKLRPEQMNVGLVRPDAQQIWKNHPKMKVKTLSHYGVKYTVSKITDWAKDWKSWATVAPTDDAKMSKTYSLLAQRLRKQDVSFDGDITIQLPGVIADIPDQFPLTNATAESGRSPLLRLWGQSPTTLEKSNDVELWFRKGWMSPKPWVEASMTLRTRRFTADKAPSAHDIVKLQVGMHLLADELNQRLADTGYKGFQFSVSETYSGVYIWLSGFTPNLLQMTDRLLAEISAAFDVDQKRANVSLARTLGSLKTDFTDFSDEPVKTAFGDQKILLTARAHSKAELANALQNGPKIKYSDAKKAVEDARRGPFYATTVIFGNYDKEGAKLLHKKLLDGLGAKVGVSGDQVEKISPVVSPKAPVEIRKTNPRDGDKNHVTIVTILAGPATVENRVLLGLVGSIFAQLAFAELRTRMQLGYVVGGGVSEMSNVLTIDCYVQGSNKLPDLVEADCENVLAVSVPNEVSKLDDATFAAHKNSFKSSLLEGPRTSNQELSHFENPILLGGCMDLRSSMLAFLETVVSKDQLLKAWSNVIMPMDGKKVAARKKIVTKYFNDGMKVPESPTAEQTEHIFKTAGITGSVLERILLERKQTRTFADANSIIRDSIVKEGGYFPAELQCSWSKQSSKNAELPVLMQTTKQQPLHPAAVAARPEIATRPLMRSEVTMRVTASGANTFED